MTPSLNLRVETHGNTVSNVGNNEDRGLIPSDHSIGNCQDQYYNAQEVAETVPRFIGVKFLRSICIFNFRNGYQALKLTSGSQNKTFVLTKGL